jgi:hypothetical protein
VRRSASSRWITAFIPHDRAGHLYDGVSQGDDLTRTTITFGRYVATLQQTSQYGWRITDFTLAPK